MPMMPMQVLADESSTTEAWAVFRTAPHTAWHVAGWYATESDAWTAACEYLEGGWSDAVVVRKVSFLTHARVPPSPESGGTK
jgi:hypothetical protein